MLLPVYFTVCHRMIPFFSAGATGPHYNPFKPNWSLPVLWLLLLAHLAGELTHRFDLLWLADVPLSAYFLAHWLAWQPWKCMKPGLLAALYLAFAWLPIAFMLFAVQSLIFRLTGDFVLGRAPVHALTIGFFGSMLVAMVTRVTQGHSGRPLAMGAIPWLTFALLQLVALTRILAETAANSTLWLVVAAAGWLIAFAPWVLRSLWIYVTPRLTAPAPRKANHGEHKNTEKSSSDLSRWRRRCTAFSSFSPCSPCSPWFNLVLVLSSLAYH